MSGGPDDVSVDGQEPLFGVVLFLATQGAIRAEKILLSANFQHKLIPVPRHISANCGFCIRFAWRDLDVLKQLLEEMSSNIQGILPL